MSAHAAPTQPTEGAHAVPGGGRVYDDYQLADTPYHEVKSLMDDLPLSIYESKKGEAYTVKYFSLDMQLARIDQTLSEKVQQVESFLKAEIEKRRLVDSTSSYNYLVREFMRILKIPQLEQPQSIFDKIYKYSLRHGRHTIRRG